MAFKKGQSGNPKGKPKGTKNKASGKLREMVTEFLEGEFDTIKATFKKLSPRDKSRFYVDLLQYGLPKLQATTHDIDFEKLTDGQLDEIIARLKNSSHEPATED